MHDAARFCRRSGAHYGVPLAFCDSEKLARHPDVDLVTVSVKVPDHTCRSWPQSKLASTFIANGRSAETPTRRSGCAMRQTAGASHHTVGLQGQVSPAINYTKDLIVDGYVGRVLSAKMIGCAPNWGPSIDRAYQADLANGANLLTITSAHTIDALCYSLRFGLPRTLKLKGPPARPLALAELADYNLDCDSLTSFSLLLVFPSLDVLQLDKKRSAQLSAPTGSG